MYFISVWHEEPLLYFTRFSKYLMAIGKWLNKPRWDVSSWLQILISPLGLGVWKHPPQKWSQQWEMQTSYQSVTNVDQGLCKYSIWVVKQSWSHANVVNFSFCSQWFDEEIKDQHSYTKMLYQHRTWALFSTSVKPAQLSNTGSFAISSC